MSESNPFTLVRRKLLAVIGGTVGVATSNAAGHPDEEDDGGTVSFEQLSQEGQSVFLAGLSNPQATRIRYEFPDELAAATAVEYQGTTYELQKRGRHVTNYEINPTKVTGRDDAVQFTALSEAEQAAFNTALSEGSFSAVDRSPETFRSGLVVEKNGTQYALNLMWGGSKKISLSVDPR